MKEDKKGIFYQNVTLKCDNYMSSIRDNIQKYLAYNNITVRKFIEISGLSSSTVNNLLYKNLSDCKLSTAVIVAKLLGVTINELTNAGLIESTVQNNITACRDLPERSKRLVRFVINEEVAKSKGDVLNNRESLSIMCPELSNDGILKTNYSYKRMDITKLNLNDDMKSKIFLGIHLDTDIYLPYYTPEDVLLLANDRRALPRENVVITINGNIFVAKQKYENNKYTYYGIRDNQFRCDESCITSVVGYVAAITQVEQLEGII